MPFVDVYVDILFLINLGMDALCLVITARLLNRSMSMLRLMLAAALGGLYGVVSLLLNVAQGWILFIDLCVCFLMCCLAFGKNKLWLTGGIYILSSMVMGGVMTALYHWLNRLGASALFPAGDEGVSSLAFALLAIFGSVFTFIWGRVFRKSEGNRAHNATLTVMINGGTVSFQGMIDSGNLLTDPLTATPVIVVKTDVCKHLLSKELQAFIETLASGMPLPAFVPEADRLRLIPASTAIGDQMLMAIRPDKIILSVDEKGSKSYEVKALVTLADLNGCSSEALVPSCLLL